MDPTFALVGTWIGANIDGLAWRMKQIWPIRLIFLVGILGGVALFFDGMIEELSGLIIRVKKASREVEASATMTLPMLAQLVHTSNVQLQESAEATGEIGQMVNSSRQVAEREARRHEEVRRLRSP